MASLAAVVAGTALAGVVVVGANGMSAPEPEDPWADLGVRQGEVKVQHDADCVPHSFGQVRDLLATTPCASLSRALFTVSNDRASAVVSVAWVEFRLRRDAREFRALEDVHGTGDITPLPRALLGLPEIPFHAHNYTSALDGATVVVAEAEPVGGQPGAEFLDDLTEVAVLIPRPPR
ncbi:hypothetical protein [Saccharothrix coeruleofusca]|uniref:Uncharacterized protein n=1 Tax=Saccharothrix coeruleofusca TaxID=33919 RepID=A0A918ANT6_9PSEU|nr:hypothetical protein [Saccharothrix coeruleofusca]MBP2337654.1 hypothetical protein [Saccharothrix coeruleofusca]GGP64382.1 hypothetical protein GCM10010185_41080 [Saccharothrix coeruleofusca]